MRNALHAAAAALRWPFVSPLASPAWLLVRLYLAWIWIRFGVAKLRAGWLGGDAMAGILEAVAQGHTPAALPAVPAAARTLLELGAAPALSSAIPLLEVALGAAFASGLLLAPAALCASLVNLGLVLAGLALWSFDGRFIALQLLLLLAWRVAGRLGLAPVLRSGPRHAGHPRPAARELAGARPGPQTAGRWPRRARLAGGRARP